MTKQIKEIKGQPCCEEMCEVGCSGTLFTKEPQEWWESVLLIYVSIFKFLKKSAIQAKPLNY